MFNNQRYITRGICDTVPQFLQIMMWELIDQTPVDKDYLQVFSLSCENGRQKIVHTQEFPEYTAEYVFESDEPVTAKVFVIDDETHSTMLLASEY